MGRIKKDNIFLLGISHKTAPVEIREKVSFDSASCGGILTGICELPGIGEGVLLSTCNRTEIYTIIEIPPVEAEKRLKDFLLDESGLDEKTLDCFYTYRGKDVIAHLYRVVSGLDSMILGEPQIFGQVKEAYATACDLKCTGTVLNRLFHTAFRVGKQIRSMTAVGEGAVSVSYAAVEMAKSVFGTLHGRSVLLVGAGKTGELSAKRLVDIGVTRILIANRTLKRARELAEKLGGETVPFEQFVEQSKEVDIIITSVAGGKTVLSRNALERYIRPRDRKPLLLIDLGVPRNIEDAAGDIDGVILKNIDDLEDLTFDNMDKRLSEAEKAEEIISGEADEFIMWLSEREVIPIIRSLHVKCENIRLEELEKIKNKTDPETMETIDLVTRRIVRKILHNPVIRMRETESGVKREQLIKSVQELFMKERE